MTSSKRLSTREVILVAIIGLFILVAVGGASYYFGYQRNIATVKFMERQQYLKDDQYSRGLANLQKENTDIATMNTVVCAEYQKLYSTYTKLYETSASQLERYTIPGSARGQVDPCYGDVSP